MVIFAGVKYTKWNDIEVESLNETEGALHFFIDGREITVSAGEVLCIPPSSEEGTRRGPVGSGTKEP